MMLRSCTTLLQAAGVGGGGGGGEGDTRCTSAWGHKWISACAGVSRDGACSGLGGKVSWAVFSLMQGFTGATNRQAVRAAP
jgi:hypothetical protein